MPNSMRRYRWITPALAGFMLATSALPLLAQTQALPPLSQPLPAAVQQGYQRLEQGRVEEAINLFQSVLTTNPNLVEAVLGLAIAYRRAGADALAFATYQQVVQLDADNVTALSALGVLGGFRPEWQATGIAALDTLLTLQPENLEARSQRALLLFYQGRFAASIADYEQVLAQPPVADAALVGAAQVYAYGGRYGAALDLFEAYLSQGNTLTGYEAIAYAFALRQTEAAAAAIAVLQPQLSAIAPLPAAAEPVQLELRSALAAAYAANGQTTAALATLEPLQNRSEARLSLARALNEIARYTGDEAIAQEAAVVYQQVLADPNLTVGVAREVAATLSAYPSQQSTTLALYRQLAAENPSDLSLRVAQAVWERQLGEISATELRQRLAPLAQQLPADGPQREAIAQALVQLDPPDPALFDLYTALAAETSVDFLDFRLAQLYLQARQTTAARTVLSRYAAAETVDEPTLFLLLAELERQEGNRASSEARYQLLIDRYGDQREIAAGALQGLAGLRQGEGQIEAALALYDQAIALVPDDVAKPLGRASIAYAGGLISEATATALLNQWLTDRPNQTPPELFSLVGALPPDRSRFGLYEQLLAIDPRFLPLRLRQIQVVALDAPETALALAAEVVAANPEAFEGYLLQGQIAQDVDALDEAATAYQAVLALDPNQVDALIGIGGVRFTQRRYQAARGYYDRALALAPNNFDLRRTSASLTAALDQPLSALNELEALQVELAAAGYSSAAIAQERRRIQERLLLQRGFLPEWERY